MVLDVFFAFAFTAQRAVAEKDICNASMAPLQINTTASLGTMGTYLLDAVCSKQQRSSAFSIKF
ncbi:hypothetical protein, partial [Acinetobacter baumannii]|uniref:hypothetical protein n=1 Tax=Acinetobacter baumannii TaxID=470 RepID=UPI001C06622E